LNSRYGDRLQAVSAGSSPAGYVHPLAVAVMREMGIDISDGRSKHMTEFLTQPFDVVITVCDPAREACPVYPGPARRVHQSFDDPAEAAGSADEVLHEFRRVRDEMRDFLDSLFGKG